MSPSLARWLIVLIIAGGGNAHAQLEDLFDTLTERHGEKFCMGLEPLPADSCKAIIMAAGHSVAGKSPDYVRDTLKEELTSPEFLNSGLFKAFSGKVPLGMEFKALDGNAGDTVLGLSYTLNYTIAESEIATDQKLNRN